MLIPLHNISPNRTYSFFYKVKANIYIHVNIINKTTLLPN